MDEQSQTQQTPQAANSEAQSGSEMQGNSKKSILLPVGLGILIVLVAIGAYLLGTNQSKTVVQNSVQTTPIPSPTPDPTVDWENYTNIKNGYSLRYPEESFTKIDCLGEEDTLYLELKGSGYYNLEYAKEFGCTRDSKFSLELLTSDKPFEEEESISGSSFYLETYNITKTEFVIDGIKGRQYNLRRKAGAPPSPASDGTGVYFEKDNRYYSVSASTHVEPFLPQIFSTFKFTE